MGSAARSRRGYLEQLHARARDLERERDQRAALAVADERGRISRELHDVVAHGLSVMVTQAQGAAAALDHKPADTRAALTAIVDTGRGSLADMRRVLARVDGVDDAWHPQPGLERLPDLVTQVTNAGTPVRLRIHGIRPTLPAAVDLSAYRIIQEALTNTMKHAGNTAQAEVLVAHGDTDLTIEVRDNGAGTGTGTTDNGGNGLRGMRERVRLLGGHLAAGPGPAGGFVVRAKLPIHGAEP
jgi:signal transduction histidine kinase